MHRRFYFLAALVLAIITGCNDAAPDKTHADGGTKPAGDKKLRIAVIPKGTSHQFWKSVDAGALKAEKEFGVEIVFKGPTGEGDAAKQIETVENFLADGYDGICLAPLDGKALRKPVDQALADKVPVVIFDSGLSDSTGITSFVATNNHRGGERAGEYLAKLLGGKGKVVLMRYQINSASTEAREQGFLDAIHKFSGIEVLSDNQYGGPDEAAAVKLGENFLSNFGDQMDGIFCPNESTASGMLTALEHDPHGLAGKIKFVGFDSSDNLIRGLKDKHLNATVLQDPVQMGYDAVRVMVDKLHGKPVPDKIEVPEALATTDNLDDPKIDALLHPEKVK